MTEDEAKGWLRDTLHVPRETIDLIETFLCILRDEAERQNLIARSTFGTIWSRHVVDSAQLVPLMRQGSWIDLGSGAGFPGLIIALLTKSNGTLVDSRRKRVTFLQQAVEVMGIADRVTIVASRVELLEAEPHDVIIARAYAPLPALLKSAQHLATRNTRWLLPKGQSAHAELDEARRSWQGDFRVVQSVTDPASAIVVAENVRPRSAR